MKPFLKNISLFLLSTFITLLVLELVFRWLIPASETPTPYYDEQFKTIRFIPFQSGVATRGIWGKQPAHWQINNEGWNSPQNYDTTDTRPLIAIIGDSYIEATQVDIERSYPSLLQKLLPQYRVYQFGISGAPLSHYLQMSRYVRQQFRPQILIFNIVHNDFEKSFYQFSQKGKGYLTLDSVSFHEIYTPFAQPSFLKKWARHSKLACYIMRNTALNIKLAEMGTAKSQFAQNIDIAAAQAMKQKIHQATDLLLNKIKQENGSTDIIFVMDGLRDEMYANQLKNTQIGWLNLMMKQTVASKGMKFIDLTNVFLTDYQQHKRRFETRIDNHWNEYGHQKVTEAVFEFITKNETKFNSHKR